MSDHGHAHHPALQHHFTTMAQQREAGVLGMWVFLLTEVLFFGGLFITYTVYRMWYYDAFAAASKSIAIVPGLVNTVVLIGSSLTMALSVRAAQTNQRKATVNWLLATIVLGTVFLGIKVYEYADKFEHHHVPGATFQFAPEHEGGAAAAEDSSTALGAGGHVATMGPDQLQRTTQIFFSLYFLMTGLHAIHMIVGVVILFIIAWMAHKGRFDSEYHAPVEMTGLYWHFVDIVWIFLFPLLYLVERHN
ncbi:MAG: cytochrome c oxidase subunit 3 family protein [Acidobacteria bacterium]|nr:cytochrome c oxidase subunit 3 family protein [Acidobacteriota bacterium]